MDHDSFGSSQPNQMGQPSVPQPTVTPPSPYTPLNHQLPEHGSPDPAPAPTSKLNFTAPVPATPVPQSIYPDTAPSSYMPTTSSMSLDSRVDTKRAPSITPENTYTDRPVPVVRVLSVRGIEYAMMSIMLWVWAGALITILVAIIMGSSGFSELAFPVSLLVVAGPIFALLYIRLRKAELRDPSLRLDPSKRRFSQITQIVAFLACFFNIVATVYVLMGAVGGTNTASIGKYIGSTVVVLMVAGSVLAYYWFDEHKLVK